MCIVFLLSSRIFRFINFLHFLHRQVIVPFFILSAGNRCCHITSAESCKQLAACLFRKIWYQHLIIFRFISFLHFVHRQVILSSFCRQVISVITSWLHQQVTTHRQVIGAHLLKMVCFRFSLADIFVGLLQEHNIWRMMFLRPCAKLRFLRR